MISARIKHSIFALGLVVVVYWAYAFCAVPFIEPNTIGDFTAEDRDDSPERRVRPFDELIEDMFPPDAWERDVPKIVSTEHGMLLFKEYETLDDGRLVLTPCTLIFDSGGGKRPGIDAEFEQPLIMRAPNQADLLFDGPLDLARGKVGKLIGGRLVGNVTISRPETGPGKNDALLITTSNVQMDERHAWTPHPVRFLHGSSFGSGRDLIITLLPPESQSPDSTTPAVGGIKSLELVHVDQIRVELQGDGLLAAGEQPAASAVRLATTPATGAKEDQTVSIRCQGPFLFDFVNRVATFEKKVQITRQLQRNNDDRLLCDLLEIHFDAGKAAEKENKPKKSPNDENPFGEMRASRVVATGQPVVIESSSTGGRAVGEELSYDVINRRIRLSGERPVRLVYQQTIVDALSLEYELAESGKIGRLWAKGPGRIENTSRATDNDTFTANWGKQLTLQPQGDFRVISLTGGAALAMAASGRISAKEIHAWFSEDGRKPPPRNAFAPPPVIRAQHTEPDGLAKLQKSSMQFSRLLALENVHIESRRVTGDTGRLEVWLEDAPVKTARTPAAGQRPGASNRPRPAAQPAKTTNEGNLLLAGKDAENQSSYVVQGRRMRLRLLRKGEQTNVDEVTLEGGVRLTEQPPAGPRESPLKVTGEFVRVQNANLPSASVKVLGKPAHVTARDLQLTAANIGLHRGKNRLWVEGPGEIGVPLKQTGQRGLTTSGTADDQLSVRWKAGMMFDGIKMLFEEDVIASTQMQMARAGKLELVLTKAIDFNAPKQNEKPQLRYVTFDNGVYMEQQTRDGRVLTAIDRLNARTLTIDQASGRMKAEGPGWFRTVRLGDAADLTALPGETNRLPRPPAQDRDDRELLFVGVSFQGGIAGNLENRQIEFQQRVRCNYGPVTRWDQTVDADSPQGLGPRDVTLTCERLSVAEITAVGSPTRQFELNALGNAFVEGQTFSARAARISYTQAKDLLIMEGDGRNDAQLWRQASVGGAVSRAAAGKILFWRGANRVEIDDAQYIDLSR
jgi:lipopolysaccharide export system protein LptA